MADENKTAYASREWHTGDVITADALNKIENEMEYVSAEVTNAVTGTINDQKLNDTIARKLDSIVKYFPEEPTEENLEHVRMYVQPAEDNGEITVPTIDDYETFKTNFVQPYTNKAYAVGDYVEYGDVIYRVISVITKNGNLADDEAWAALIAQTPSPVTSIDVMQELNGLINVYTSDNQVTPERNKIWIKQQGESVEVPTYEEFSNAVQSVSGNNIIPMTNGAYIAVGESTIAIDSPTPYASYRYAKIACEAGDVFTINASASSGAKPYGFSDGEGNTIDRPYMTSKQVLTLENFVVQAPVGAEWLVINDKDDMTSFYGDVVGNNADEARLIANSIMQNAEIPLISQFYFSEGTLKATGEFNYNAYRIATRNYIDVSGYSSVNYTVETGYKAYAAFYSDTKESAYVNNDGWKTGSGTINVKGKYMRLVIDTTGGSTVLSPSDASNVTITGAYVLKDIIDRPDYEYNETLSDGADLNSLYKNGWYLLDNAGQYPNSPESATGQRIVFVYTVNNTPSATAFRHMFYANRTSGVYAHRVYASGNWTKWTFISDGQMTLESFTPTAQTTQGANVGYNLRMMTYNVAEYDNDTSTHISNEQLFNLRRMLGKANADIICVQEDQQYIDVADSQESHKYVFLPQYPYKRGGSGGVIHSKMSPIDSATEGSGINLVHSNGRYIRFATYQLNENIKLLVMCAHPVYNQSGGGTSQTSIDAREIQYTEMFEWAAGNIDLNDKETGTAIHVPTHTHTIIGIDANSATDADKIHLTSLAGTYHYKMANGGALGWFVTEFRYNYSIDNIIVSDNIIINNAETYNNWLNKLYSDHVPLVADLTLL